MQRGGRNPEVNADGGSGYQAVAARALRAGSDEARKD
jgi:hypothetical protein